MSLRGIGEHIGRLLTPRTKQNPEEQARAALDALGTGLLKKALVDFTRENAAEAVSDATLDTIEAAYNKIFENWKDLEWKEPYRSCREEVNILLLETAKLLADYGRLEK